MTQTLKKINTKTSANDLIIDREVFDFGKYSWVYDNTVNGKPTISVQWLQWQGAEFRIVFNSSSKRDDALKALLYLFKPKFKHNKNDVYLYGKKYDFSIEKTISPLLLFKFLKNNFDAIELHLTPTSATTREFMYAKNWNLIQNEHTTKIYDRQNRYTGDYLIVTDSNEPLLSEELQ